eukprot:COSAG06_NODE_17772_length_922_cov_0.979344_2_plen_77_part_01
MAYTNITRRALLRFCLRAALRCLRLMLARPRRRRPRCSFVDASSAVTCFLGLNVKLCARAKHMQERLEREQRRQAEE